MGPTAGSRLGRRHPDRARPRGDRWRQRLPGAARRGARHHRPAHRLAGHHRCRGDHAGRLQHRRRDAGHPDQGAGGRDRGVLADAVPSRAGHRRRRPGAAGAAALGHQLVRLLEPDLQGLRVRRQEDDHAERQPWRDPGLPRRGPHGGADELADQRQDLVPQGQRVHDLVGEALDERTRRPGPAELEALGRADRSDGPQQHLHRGLEEVPGPRLLQAARAGAVRAGEGADRRLQAGRLDQVRPRTGRRGRYRDRQRRGRLSRRSAGAADQRARDLAHADEQGPR
uniref:Uncharacterized protein n=1 Tax=Janibacter limosus TaxID=53458 RepID=A0AC61U0N9_9MICO|nr:hypothetical protein [Janibacter limosus]